MFIRYMNIVMGGRTGPLIITEMDAPTTELRSDHKDRINRDGLFVSREWLGKASWRFTVATNGESLVDSLALAGQLEAAWKDQEVRSRTTPASLDYSHDGKTWYRILGRPGRFTSFVPDVHAKLGVGVLDLEWVQTDPRHFSTKKSVTRIEAVPASIGGIVAPLVSPISTTATGAPRVGRLVNDGDQEAPLTVKFYGPSTNPTIRNEKGYEISYHGTLAYDRSVTIDPLNHSVRMNNGTHVPGRLSRRTRLSSLVVPVGASDWTYVAEDQTGTSRAELVFSEAYSHMK